MMPKKIDISKAQHIIALDPISYKELKKYEDAQNGDEEAKAEIQRGNAVLEMISKSLSSQGQEKAQRLAFEVDPDKNYSGYASLYRAKTDLTPDHILKRITGPQGDELVCQILQARANIISSYGRPRTSRFSIGFDFEEMKSSAKKDTEQDQNALQAQMDAARELLWNCGHEGLEEDYHPNLSQFLKMITRDGLTFGRFAVEYIWKTDAKTGKKSVHSFRPVDSGTIYRVMPYAEHDQTTRTNALRILQKLKNEKFEIENYKKDEYRWAQVIQGVPRQGFTEEELVVYNMFPVTNVEYNGYPITPIDQAIHAITTHINITMHNKLYFQNGRAARGMLVFKSDSLDEGAIQKIRLQFHQSINSVQNSWRMPVFGIGTEDEVSWQSIDIQGRDAEFQYMTDNNARVILSAFLVSPEELPGYSHLARGTNSQALSESDNEWKLTAARDVGLRPLLYDIQDFLNTHVLAVFFPELAKTHQLVLTGLDKDSPEKEATRLQQDIGIHMTYDEVMDQVEKDRIGKELGGELPLNPQFQQILQGYFTVGEVLENFCGRKGAAADPRFNYYRDPFWFQWQQILLQKAQMAMQAQMQMQQQQQQAAMAAQGIQPPGQDDGQGGGQEGPPEEDVSKMELLPVIQMLPANAKPEEIRKVEADNAARLKGWQQKSWESLQKRIKNNHNEISKMILARHSEITKKRMKEWEDESRQAVKKIGDTLKGIK